MLSGLRVLLFALLFVPALSAMAETPLRVLTSIKPLQLIAIAVGGDAVHVEALLDPQFSPHDYQLRPSDRMKLNDAAIVFWVGPELEAFLQQPLKSLEGRAVVIGLQDADVDPHVWMDPLMAISMAQRMAEAMSSARPEKRAYFAANSERLAAALRQQDAEHRAQLRRAGALRGFMVSHDAYSRFERRYGLAHRAALTDAADMPPSVKTLMGIEQELADGRIACIWRQPHESKLYERVVAGKNIRVTTIDAMAAEVLVDVRGIEIFYQRLWQAVMGCVAG
ncbi:MAG: zinc ABC transporter substrate-binding protein [Spongiibacteraceae bacterium]